MNTTITPAEAAEDLEIVQGHLARYAERLGALATHLEASHKVADVAAMVLSDDPHASLTGRHEHLHTPALDAAKRALAEAQNAAAS